MSLINLPLSKQISLGDGVYRQTPWMMVHQVHGSSTTTGEDEETWATFHTANRSFIKLDLKHFHFGQKQLSTELNIWQGRKIRVCLSKVLALVSIELLGLLNW